jgi:predicted phage terminase large subunit-like protein
LEFLLERKTAMAQASWESEYQQNPIIVGGGMFPIERITAVPERPAARDVVSAARYWDKAGTAGGGAYSAGVLMLRMRDGTFVVCDVRRGQWSALDRERVIKQTAEIDRERYPPTKIYVEQEPGSSGKESAEASIRMLAGYSVQADRVSGAKEVRAEPFAAQWQAGNVRLVAAPWNRDYLDEHESFPSGRYKDQVDASSGAFNKIASKYRYDSTLAWVS